MADRAGTAHAGLCRRRRPLNRRKTGEFRRCPPAHPCPPTTLSGHQSCSRGAPRRRRAVAPPTRGEESSYEDDVERPGPRRPACRGGVTRGGPDDPDRGAELHRRELPELRLGPLGHQPHYTLTRVGNGGRFTLTPGSASYLTQFYMGWGTNIPQVQTGPVPLHPAADAHHRPGESVRRRRSSGRDKFIILGDGGDSSSRVIVELRPNMQDNGARDPHPEEHRGRRSADAAAAAAHRPAARAAVRGAERQLRPRGDLAEQRQLQLADPHLAERSTCRPTPGTTSASATTRTPRSRPAAASPSR